MDKGHLTDTPKLPCPACGGDGLQSTNELLEQAQVQAVKCPDCLGSGTVTPGLWLGIATKPCQQCSSTGGYQMLGRPGPGFWRRCSPCNGSGKVPLLDQALVWDGCGRCDGEGSYNCCRFGGDGCALEDDQVCKEHGATVQRQQCEHCRGRGKLPTKSLEKLQHAVLKDEFSVEWISGPPISAHIRKHRRYDGDLYGYAEGYGVEALRLAACRALGAGEAHG